MEKKDNQLTQEKEYKWRKEGGGTFTMKNMIIKPGQEFYAKESEIPKAFRDVLIPVNPEEMTEANKAAELELEKALKPVFTIAPNANATTRFDVLNAEGFPVNGKPLSKPAAEKLKESLEL